ncbi:hypothetical protein GQ44DRAFT_715427 [Phaeosphaeriaceae sp. PMI808]|nr:hypothetical protein GQ44DRAFT_715427 [Phaeosphaeriaceae sp. PMI808]
MHRIHVLSIIAAVIVLVSSFAHSIFLMKRESTNYHRLDIIFFSPLLSIAIFISTVIIVATEQDFLYLPPFFLFFINWMALVDLHTEPGTWDRGLLEPGRLARTKWTPGVWSQKDILIVIPCALVGGFAFLLLDYQLRVYQSGVLFACFCVYMYIAYSQVDWQNRWPSLAYGVVLMIGAVLTGVSSLKLLPTVYLYITPILTLAHLIVPTVVINWQRTHPGYDENLTSLSPIPFQDVPVAIQSVNKALHEYFEYQDEIFGSVEDKSSICAHVLEILKPQEFDALWHLSILTSRNAGEIYQFITKNLNHEQNKEMLEILRIRGVEWPDLELGVQTRLNWAYHTYRQGARASREDV